MFVARRVAGWADTAQAHSRHNKKRDDRRKREDMLISLHARLKPRAPTGGTRALGERSHHLLLRLTSQNRSQRDEQQGARDVAARALVQERQERANRLRPRDVAGADQHREQDAAQRPAGNQAGAEQRSSAYL